MPIKPGQNIEFNQLLPSDDISISANVNNRSSNIVYVDSIFGDDQTGQRESQTFQFRTILAAVNSSIANDLIYVNSGNYQNELLAKNDISYYFAPETILTDLSFLGTTKVYGYGRFIQENVQLLSGGGTFLAQEVVDLTSNNTFECIDKTYINIKNIEKNDDGILFSGTANIRANVIYSVGPLINTNDKIIINADSILFFKNVLSVIQGNINSQIYINANEIIYENLTTNTFIDCSGQLSIFAQSFIAIGSSSITEFNSNFGNISISSNILQLFGDIKCGEELNINCNKIIMGQDSKFVISQGITNINATTIENINRTSILTNGILNMNIKYITTTSLLLSITGGQFKIIIDVLQTSNRAIRIDRNPIGQQL